jgi:hypothetical protein
MYACNFVYNLTYVICVTLTLTVILFKLEAYISVLYGGSLFSNSII